jgi:hypothetical protein
MFGDIICTWPAANVWISRIFICRNIAGPKMTITGPWHGRNRSFYGIHDSKSLDLWELPSRHLWNLIAIQTLKGVIVLPFLLVVMQGIAIGQLVFSRAKLYHFFKDDDHGIVRDRL